MTTPQTPRVGEAEVEAADDALRNLCTRNSAIACTLGQVPDGHIKYAIKAALTAAAQARAASVTLEKRPVAWAIKSDDGWMFFTSEENAINRAKETGAIYYGLYIRDGAASVTVLEVTYGDAIYVCGRLRGLSLLKDREYSQITHELVQKVLADWLSGAPSATVPEGWRDQIAGCVDAVFFPSNWDHNPGQRSFEAADLILKKIAAAPTTTVPEGWKLVPVEPTPAMAKAGYEAMCEGLERGEVQSVEDNYRAMLAAAPTAPTLSRAPGVFTLGDRVRKKQGAQWHGKVVGTYHTDLTPEGYCVESEREKGAVQIYPAQALEHHAPSRAPTIEKSCFICDGRGIYSSTCVSTGQRIEVECSFCEGRGKTNLADGFSVGHGESGVE